MTPLFIGSGVALVTPFDKDGKIDFEKFIKLIEFQIANNTDAVIVCGTTGEGSTLTVSERLKLFEIAADTVNHRVPIICGTGSNSTSFTLDFAKQAEKLDIDAHLIVTPYYNKTSQSGLVSHYYTIAETLTKPVYVYNVPTRTGMNIQPKTYRKLSEHENIVGVKEADANISKLIKSMVLSESKLDFYIGNDDLISVATSLGCKGVISVLSNIIPKYTHEMTMSGIIGDSVKCAQMQKRVMDFVECLFMDVNPIVIKEVMNRVGFEVGNCRLPLGRIDEKCSELIDIVLNNYVEELKEAVIVN
ncbi:MAG: 4-hydroxy-tetrahydrodipicolinate synthase [Faecalibacterium sp.]|nr:4-hydroxy-tetrahydrodipicolinate synthase [Ruminococcus sp.]MCM1392310.1 4-hydroxy-tetrahydrodipicolinate synthase [Ruminococcus sp.]MCM1484722.1 4-hydroxy-tetrahydrodipicolinate synthase [Faecalibacterium sp.]